MLQAECHKDCLKDGVERCIVGWSDGSCGGQPRGTWSPIKEREAQSSQHVADTQGSPTMMGRVGGIPIIKLNDGKRR